MKSLIVMGVAGCGKSSLGRAVAAQANVPLIEGDDFHLPASVRKMRAGVAQCLKELEARRQAG